MVGKGYFRSKVHPVQFRVAGNTVKATIRLEEGLRFRWGKIEIEGAKAISPDKILELFGQATGDIADGKRLKDFVYDRLAQEYAERGFIELNAEFEPEFIEPLETTLDGVVNVKISIDEGRAYTVRKIEFEGVDKDEAKKLIAEFPLKTGDLYARSKFEAGIDVLNKSGQYRFVDKDQHVENRTGLEAPDLYIKILVRKAIQ